MRRDVILLMLIVIMLMLIVMTVVLVDHLGRPTRSFIAQRHVFGDTPQEQQSVFEQDIKAYYGLIYDSNIMSKVNMSPEFQAGTSMPNKNAWLQTVTIV